MTKKIQFKDLDRFTEGYINAALILSADVDDEFSEYYQFTNFSDDSLNQILQDCLNFQKENKDLLDIAQEMGLSSFSAGNDYWLTRNGHGSGYWDRELKNIGELLTEKAKNNGESSLYISDDHKCEVVSNLSLSNKVKP